MNNQRGFSILELLLVVLIIGLIAAIAIPNLLAARRAANEGSATSALRTLHGANVSFAASSGTGNYAGLPSTPGTSSLADLANSRLIDDILGNGLKSGFVFIGDREQATPTDAETFYFSANPQTASGLLLSGTKRFGVATDGVIRYDATPADLGTAFDAVSLAAATPTQ